MPLLRLVNVLVDAKTDRLESHIVPNLILALLDVGPELSICDDGVPLVFALRMQLRQEAKQM